MRTVVRPPIENDVLLARMALTDRLLSPVLRGSLDLGFGLAARRYRRYRPDVDSIPAVSTTSVMRVTGREAASDDGTVVSFTLTPVIPSDVTPWFPGAHLDVTLGSGRTRQYSICGDPDDPTCYRIAVRRIDGGRGGSKELHSSVVVGDVVTVSGPRNAFPFATIGHFNTHRRRLRFVAGGIGITPILPMAELADRIGLDWSLIYLGRDRASLPFLDRVAALGDRVTVHTEDAAGLLTIDEILPNLDADTAVYCCGPEGLIELVEGALVHRAGVEMHAERFSAAPIRDGRPFQVQLGEDGRLLDVAADQSMLDAILAVRPGTPHSCKQGFCGTCRMRVLHGAVDHRDSTLTAGDRQSGAVLPCVSRADERIVLDL